jgi:hypothetical protein
VVAVYLEKNLPNATLSESQLNVAALFVASQLTNDLLGLDYSKYLLRPVAEAQVRRRRRRRRRRRERERWRRMAKLLVVFSFFFHFFSIFFCLSISLYLFPTSHCPCAPRQERMLTGPERVTSSWATSHPESRDAFALARQLLRNTRIPACHIRALPHQTANPFNPTICEADPLVACAC